MWVWGFCSSLVSSLLLLYTMVEPCTDAYKCSMFVSESSWLLSNSPLLLAKFDSRLSHLWSLFPIQCYFPWKMMVIWSMRWGLFQLINSGIWPFIFFFFLRIEGMFYSWQYINFITRSGSDNQSRGKERRKQRTRSRYVHFYCHKLNLKCFDIFSGTVFNPSIINWYNLYYENFTY